MDLSKDETIEKNGRQSGHCNRNTLLSYEYELTCVACGYNVIKTKHELSKVQRKKNYQSIKVSRIQNTLHMCRCI